MESAIGTQAFGYFNQTTKYKEKPARYIVTLDRENNYFIVKISGIKRYTVDRGSHVVWNEFHNSRVTITPESVKDSIMSIIESLEERLA